MKIKLNNNAELIIQANMKKEGDYQAAMKIAEKMTEEEGIDIASADETEGWIHICAVWNHFQKAELKDAWEAAKAA